MARPPRASTTRDAVVAAHIKLPKPIWRQPGTLAAALRSRRTIREIGPRELSSQQLSQLLWAACGINRSRGPFGLTGRTAGSASNSQEIDIYVALAGGTYLYDPECHGLQHAVPEDLRPLALGGGQGALGADAPVRLIYVADMRRLSKTQGFDEPGLHRPATRRAYAYADTGLIAQNVYLYAAASGLAAWLHHCDHAALRRSLGLHGEQHALFGQTVGYPKRRG